MLINRTNSVLCFVSHCFWVLSLHSFASSKELPAALKDLKCSLTKNFDSCYLENANKAIPLLAEGDPEYGIPKMTPLQISSINLISTPSLRVDFKNVEVHGLDKMKVTGHKGDLKSGSVTIDLIADNITIVGDYDADGRISVMPLKGKGKFSIYLKNGKYRNKITLKVIEKNGEKYVKIPESQFDAMFEKIIFNLENLFEGNKELGDQMNAFLNENWETLFAEFGPGIKKTISGLLNTVFDSVASVVPMKNIFLP